MAPARAVPRRGRLALLLVVALLVLGLTAASRASANGLVWRDCGDGFQCSTFAVPRDYAQPKGPALNLAVVRLPAQDKSRRIGSLFVNFGGPGGDVVDTIKAVGKDLFGTLNQRFDIVGFDPRGVGQSDGAIDCKVNQETQGLYAQPFFTPENLDVNLLVSRSRALVAACVRNNADILPYASTASAARDMDALRAAVGDAKLSYLGFSWGSFLGSTYASLFPGRYRALVLDGAVDADQYINRPSEGLREQSQGFEREQGRFMQACARDQTACLGFGGADPWDEYDQLVDRANATPIPAGGDDPRPVDGDDINFATAGLLYAKQLWPLLAQALAQADAGDATLMRALVDSVYGRLPDGTFDPGADRYFTLGAIEQRYPSDIGTFLDAGRQAWGLFDHAYWNTGYPELPYGLWPVHAKGVYSGPFRAAASSPTVLVVSNTYDPATPYRGAKRLVAQLGNARLLTMRGDGHTAYGGNSACIDAAVDAYFTTQALPAVGTSCKQEVPFVQPQPAARSRVAAAAARSNRSLPRISSVVAAATGR
jgi:pimeloyl-ACP methyl ester carboxylesterase